jgi:hypothetical protein
LPVCSGVGGGDDPAIMVAHVQEWCGPRLSGVPSGCGQQQEVGATKAPKSQPSDHEVEDPIDPDDDSAPHSHAPTLNGSLPGDRRTWVSGAMAAGTLTCRGGRRHGQDCHRRPGDRPDPTPQRDAPDGVVLMVAQSRGVGRIPRRQTRAPSRLGPASGRSTRRETSLARPAVESSSPIVTATGHFRSSR